MKIQICPECKEVIPEGKLRGSSKTCTACFRRTSPADLVIKDTEEILGGTGTSRPVEIKPVEAVYESASKSMWDDEENEQAAQNPPPTAAQQQFGAQIPGNFQDRVNAFGNMLANIANVPQLQDFSKSERIKLDKLQLCEGAEWDGGFGSRCIVYKSGKTGGTLGFGIVWLGFCVFFFSMVLFNINWEEESGAEMISLILFAMIFIGIGIGLVYSGVSRKYSSVWIEIGEDTLSVERGMHRKGNKKVFPRNLRETTVVCDSNESVNKTPLFHIIIQSGEVSQKIVSGLYRNDAMNLYQMVCQILNAEV